MTTNGKAVWGLLLWCLLVGVGGAALEQINEQYARALWGVALLVGCGLGAIRMWSIRDGWKMKYQTFIFAIFLTLIALRGAFFALDIFIEKPDTDPFTAVEIATDFLTSATIAALGAVGAFLYWDLSPRRLNGDKSILMRDVDLRPFSRD